jgi:hypothetical protein
MRQPPCFSDAEEVRISRGLLTRTVSASSQATASHADSAASPPKQPPAVVRSLRACVTHFSWGRWCKGSTAAKFAADARSKLARFLHFLSAGPPGTSVSSYRMPCKEYERLKHWYDLEMSTWAQYTYPQNQHLCGGVGDRKKKQIANEARDRATLKTREMHSHRESCDECKREVS